MCYNLSQVIEDIDKAISRGFKIPQKTLDRYWKLTGHEYPQASFFVKDTDGLFKLMKGQWGLVPSWTQGIEKAKSIREYTLNAMIESADEKPSYKHLLSSHRCIIPASGFYEWREVNKQKYPYYIYPKDHSFFCVGGLWDEWKNPLTNEIEHSFTVLTTAANPLMEFIHNRKKRMPVIIQEEDLQDFANPDIPLDKFIESYPEELMEAHTISRLVTSRTEDLNCPEVILPYSYPELNELF